MSNLSATVLRAVLALGLSFALWAFVSFSQNPEELASFPEVPIEVTGLGDDLVLVDQNGMPNPTLPTVDITLRTDQRQRADLRSVDIRAVIDLTGLSPGEHNVPVNVQPTRSNLSFTIPPGGVQPPVVTVRIEPLISRSVPIDVQIVGNLPFSFERGDAVVTNGGITIGEVLLSGPQSRTERVMVARATVNIEQLRASYLAPLTLTPVNDSGQPVEGVELAPDVVTVLVPIRSVVGLKLVPVEPQIIGQPAPGFEVTAVEVEPPLIAITGSSGPLDEVDSLRTAEVDISGIASVRTYEARLIFPTGISAREGEPVIVEVTVRVAPITRPFQVTLPVQVELTGIGSGLLANVNPTVVQVTVAGPAVLLNELAAATLLATVDLGGLGPGNYELPVSVNIPQGLSLVEPIPTVSVNLRLPPTAIPPTETPTEPVEQATTTATPPQSTPTADEVPSQETVTPTPEPQPEPTTTATPEP
ncbi:MAG: hypothetical protein HC822_13955 [Oscillochloris sp.]|nr:hypothetical protein [Oscillochloris sp.]